MITRQRARAIHWLGRRATFFATSAETGSAFAIWMDEPPPGRGPVPQVHTREEQGFYVLEGNITFWCAGQEFAPTPGAYVGLPKGLGHQCKNVGEGPTRTVIFFVPGDCDRRRRPLGAPHGRLHNLTFLDSA